MAPVCYWWGGMWIVPAVMMLVMLTFAFFMLRRLNHGERGIDHLCKPWDRNESCRSQMAEALLRKHGGDTFDVYSAGIEPRGIDPMTIDVLQEIGINTSKLSSKALSVYMGFRNFDYMITVSVKAEKNCPTLFPSIGQRL